ncbi:hypothetical protein ACSTIF_00020, partial [Vibrio parahaemolyticus]
GGGNWRAGYGLRHSPHLWCAARTRKAGAHFGQGHNFRSRSLAMLMNTHEARLDALRKQLARDGLDGFV